MLILLLLPAVSECPVPVPPPHTTWELREEEHGLIHGSVIVFRAQMGYQLIGNPWSQCDITNNTWEQPFPVARSKMHIRHGGSG